MEERDPNVRVMSRDERTSYEGVTIDDSTGEPEDSPHREQAGYSYGSHNGGFNFGGTQGSFGGPRIKVFGWKDLIFGNMSMLTRIAIGLAILAVLAFLIFAVLPVALVVLGIGVVVYFVMQIFFS